MSFLAFSLFKQKAGSQFLSVTPLTKRGRCSDTGGRRGRQLFIWDEHELYGTEVAAADRCKQLWWHYCRRLEHHHKSVDTFQSDSGGDSGRFESQRWKMLVLWLLISATTRAHIRSPTLASLYWLVICNQWLHRKLNSSEQLAVHPQAELCCNLQFLSLVCSSLIRLTQMQNSTVESSRNNCSHPSVVF